MLSRRTIPKDLAGILFDKDGTLVDYDKTWYPLNLEAARIAGSGDSDLQQKILIACGSDPETGKTLADSVFAAASTKEIAEHMISIGSDFGKQELTMALDRLYSEGARNSVSTCDLQILMESLRAQGYQLGIASSDNENSISTTVKVHEIDEHIEFIAGYDSGHGIKPGPGMVHGFCSKIGCSPSQVIVVGDNRHDIEMGRSAEAGATIGVLSGTGSKETLGNYADFILESVSELPGLLTA
ncbi:MAG: HAD family hydrolase [Pseudomonadota bacterium]